MNDFSRRQIVKGAAWALPVIAVAAATPLAAASEMVDEPAVCGLYHQSGNNGRYLVYSDRVVVSYDKAPDIYEMNVRFEDGSTHSFGTNYGTAPSQGSLEWVVWLDKKPAWIQVHGFNDHFGEVC